MASKPNPKIIDVIINVINIPIILETLGSPSVNFSAKYPTVKLKTVPIKNATNNSIITSPL